MSGPYDEDADFVGTFEGSTRGTGNAVKMTIVVSERPAHRVAIWPGDRVEIRVIPAQADPFAETSRSALAADPWSVKPAADPAPLPIEREIERQKADQELANATTERDGEEPRRERLALPTEDGEGILADISLVHRENGSCGWSVSVMTSAGRQAVMSEEDSESRDAALDTAIGELGALCLRQSGLVSQDDRARIADWLTALYDQLQAGEDAGIGEVEIVDASTGEIVSADEAGRRMAEGQGDEPAPLATEQIIALRLLTGFRPRATAYVNGGMVEVSGGRGDERQTITLADALWSDLQNRDLVGSDGKITDTGRKHLAAIDAQASYEAELGDDHGDDRDAAGSTVNGVSQSDYVGSDFGLPRVENGHDTRSPAAYVIIGQDGVTVEEQDLVPAEPECLAQDRPHPDDPPEDFGWDGDPRTLDPEGFARLDPGARIAFGQKSEIIPINAKGIEANVYVVQMKHGWVSRYDHNSQWGGETGTWEAAHVQKAHATHDLAAAAGCDLLAGAMRQIVNRTGIEARKKACRVIVAACEGMAKRFRFPPPPSPFLAEAAGSKPGAEAR